MSKDYLTLPPIDMRRADRAMTDDEWIGAFLKRTAVGTLATVHNDQPFLNTNLFVYDEARHAIYFHTANVGRTPANIANHDKVCFTAFEMGRLLPAAEALEFSVEYQSVMVFGTAVLVTDASEAEGGLQHLLDKYAPHLRPGSDYRPITPEELKRTAVFRLDISDWIGKKKEVAADFPGAFYYSDHRIIGSSDNRVSEFR